MGRVAKTVLIVLLLLSGFATASPVPTDGAEPMAGEEANCGTTAATVAQAAQQICGSTLTGEALLSARLQPDAAESPRQLGNCSPAWAFKQP